MSALRRTAAISRHLGPAPPVAPPPAHVHAVRPAAAEDLDEVQQHAGFPLARPLEQKDDGALTPAAVAELEALEARAVAQR